MEYEVTFNGKTLSSETVTNDEGSFICIPNFNLMFETGIEKNAITPMCYRTAESSTVKKEPTTSQSVHFQQMNKLSRR